MKNKKLGRKYGVKEQAKGFSTFVTVIMILIIACIAYGKVEAMSETTPSTAVAEMTMGWSHIKNKYYGNQYPGNVEERRAYILEYLVWKFPELTNEEINNLVNIASKESSAHDPKIEPRSWVKHCQRPNNTYYAIEFGECNYKEVHREKSFGIFQILPSSYKRYGCEGDIKNVDNQINCGVKIYKKSGYGAWYTSSKKLNII